MVNRFFGEGPAKSVDGTPYILRCDFNAMADFESATKKDAFETFEKLDKGEVSATDLISLTWSLLLHHHPDVSRREAGGVLSNDIEAVLGVVRLASPQPEDVGGATINSRGKNRAPQKVPRKKSRS
ncbi:MAG: hypothetical protein ABJO67_03440 [Pseudoruegeria sp.]